MLPDGAIKATYYSILPHEFSPLMVASFCMG